MQLQTYIFISRSGGGKGTQIDLLSKYFKDNSFGETFVSEAGQRFRDFISSGSYTAELSKEINNQGLLQPTFLSVWAWTGDLIRNLDGHHNLFIDGTPRKLDEAKVLDGAMKFYGRENVKVIYINVSREEAKRRMLARKRGDDNEKSIDNRLNWFDTEVLPVIDFFSKKEEYEIIEVNGERPPEDVYKEILSRLDI